MESKQKIRQQKYRARMKKEGLKQQTFYLSEAAMNVIRLRKEETQLPSLNDALELILISPSSATVPEEQTVQNVEQIERQNAIFKQAKRIADVYRVFQASPTNETRNTWGVESRKLTLLIDPKPIVKPPAKPEIKKYPPKKGFIKRLLGSN